MRGIRAMMMFWKAGIAFLAVPKTGTQAYAAELGEHADMVIRHPPGLKHMTAQRFERKFRPLLPPPPGRRLETLAVIREPVDWLASWFRYRSRPQIDGKPTSTAGLSFEAFVEGYLRDVQPPWARIGSQHRFVSAPDGTLLVEHLFAYEQQRALRGFLSERLGRQVEAPPARNVSPALPVALSDELAARLRVERREDFALHESLSQSDSGRSRP